MKFTEVKNLVWCDPDHAAFNADVVFDGLGEVPFCCNVNDAVSHAQEIWSRATAGEFGPIAAYIPPPEPEPNPVQPAVDGAQTL